MIQNNLRVQSGTYFSVSQWRVLDFSDENIFFYLRIDKKKMKVEEKLGLNLSDRGRLLQHREMREVSCLWKLERRERIVLTF